MKRLSVLFAVFSAAFCIVSAAFAQTDHTVDGTRAIRVTAEEEHYIFELDETVERTHVYYNNRFGIELAADLYISKDADLSVEHPAIIIGPPFGGVKEQGPGVYANQLAQRGFVVLAFDPAYHGYSGGEPRMTASVTMYAEDFSAAVDYIGTRDFVNRNQIGVIGICGSGGFALSAAAMDTRIKAVATSVMYDIAASNNSMRSSGMLDMAGEARWTAFETGVYDYMKSYPDEPVDEIPSGLFGPMEEFFSFYGTPRGWHQNALGNINMASMGDMSTFLSNTHIAEISPRPILFVTGDIAHSRSFSEIAFDNAAEPKELYIVEGAGHVDLYDDTEKIPFDKFESFFKTAFGIPMNEDVGSDMDMKIRISDGQNTVIYLLNDSPAAKSLYSQLPFTVEVSNYSSNEKIFYPPEGLDETDGIEGNGPYGTLAYFSPWDNLVMFYSEMGAYPGLYILGEPLEGEETIPNMNGTVTVDKVD